MAKFWDKTEKPAPGWANEGGTSREAEEKVV